jgi:isoleucyl-tRNA synthetase
MSRKESEQKISKFWQENSTFTKSVAERPHDRTFVFYDGPPFATGLPHYGHIQGLTCKDLFPRFWTMKGYRSERRWGWDCHGLPIENIAEKELDIKEKKQIESMGIGKFNEFCRSKVLFFADEWKKTVDRVGIWMEFENSYKTMDNSYMESVWYIFKNLHSKGYIYEGKKVLLFCPHCQTPLSNTEIAMDNSYKTVTEKSATAKFRLRHEENTFLLAWTTTPWTLIGNVAIAVNTKLIYVKVKVADEFFILAKERLAEITDEHEVIEEFIGEKLLHKEYEPLYEIPSDKKGHYVINGGDEVSATEGTGMVHMAAYGEFDYEMIKKYDLPLVQHVGKHGKLISGPQAWLNLWFKKADKHVLEDLTERKLLFNERNYTHPYPFCYRCETPLFYHAVDSWFVNIQKIKSKLLERNSQINWHPSHLKDGRFKDILETAPDWSISRNRFWATSIPVWKCPCSEIKIIGSITELQTHAIEQVPDTIDLHKHVTDKIHLTCEKCSQKMTRIPEVFDCWFESGSMPYAAKHYPFENKDWFSHNFPCDFVAEYIGQVRAWFYYMHVIGVLLFDQAPFKNVRVTGNILASDGAKMSKSKKNYPDPETVLDKYGADSLRFYLMSSSLMKAEDLNFKEDNLKEVYRKVIVILTNVKKFYEIFNDGNTITDDSSSQYVLDRWIISRLHDLIKKATQSLDNYEPIPVCTEILSFIDDLSTWYVRRSRARFKSEIPKVKTAAIHTLAYVLIELSKVCAPIMPFIAEEIYQSFKLNSNLQDSVHLDAWPRHDATLIQDDLHHMMQLSRTIVSQVLDQREHAKIPVRQVLQTLTIKGVALAEEYLTLIREEINVKEIKILEGDEMSVELDTELTTELLREGLVRNFTRHINNYRKELKLTIQDQVRLHVSCEESLQQTLSTYQEIIKEATNTNELTFGTTEGKEIILNDLTLTISLEKL